MPRTPKLSTPDILDDSGNLKDSYRGFIAISKYARWIEKENRRETWVETVNRYVDYMASYQRKRGADISNEVVEDIRHAITYQHIMPSMRALMTAGPALDKNHIAAFNCSFIAVDHIRAFDEALVILMHGTGLGFSVEAKHINKLPEVAESFHSTQTTVVVEDSKEGWAKALKEYLSLLWDGQLPKYDVSAVRPKGSRLKTFGGRASGPEPLADLFEFVKDILTNAAGRKLTALEVHDIMCKIGEIVVVGGVRRSALISLSDLGDREMAEAKAGAWWVNDSQRALANNSATYYSRPNMDVFFREWKNLYDSKSGERGIVNLDASRRQAEKIGRRDVKQLEGTNPCGEIILRNKGFCNLTEVVARAEDTLEDLREKVRLATILGTWQASLTNFKYLRRKWKENAEEEALLGVSLTGIFGNKLLAGREGLDALASTLDNLRELAVQTNKEEAARIGINQAGAVTCVKPSGTVSQLTGVSSGIHPWYSERYARRVRGNNADPVTRLMKDLGVPHEPEINKPEDTTVFEFPLEAPEGSILQEDLTAVEHLRLWLTYRNHWTEHNPSITVTVEEHEWLEVGAFVYEHFDQMSGVSFLPGAGNHTYQQAPFEALDEAAFKTLKARTVSVPWSLLSSYETEDGTTGTQELACVAGECEVVDLEPTTDNIVKIQVPKLDLNSLNGAEVVKA